MNRERNRVVVVTGASSGIGRATARAYARKGARVVLASRSGSALETVAQECHDRGGQALVVPTDVSDEQAVHALAAAAIAAFGRIDVWVGNAGVFAYGDFEVLPSDVFRQVIDTNLFGQIHGVRAVLPHFRRQASGTLVIVASMYSRVGSPAISPYATSKFSLLGFTECLRQELRGSGIRLRVVLPGSVDTPIYQHAANVTGRRVHPLPPAASPERVARVIMRSPRRRRFKTFVSRSQTAVLPLHDLAPRVYDAVVAWLLHHVELREHNVAASTGTVFAAPDTADAVRGGWRSRGVRYMVGALATAAATALLLRARNR